jgi:pimeloyl-ACP methyl ester carboxylesterase
MYNQSGGASLAEARVRWIVGPLIVVRAGYRVMGMDLRGHVNGLRLPFSFQQCADDIAEVLSHLDMGLVRVAAHSMGGAVAQQLIARGRSDRWGDRELVRSPVALGGDVLALVVALAMSGKERHDAHA